MKRYIFFCLCLGLLTSCGSKSDKNEDKKVYLHQDEELGLTSQSECGRAEEIQGSNYVYRWIKANNGDLQRMIIQKDKKTILYDEARAGGTFSGEAAYEYVAAGKKLVFKTTTKDLKLSFPRIPFGTIENVSSGKQYVVTVLTYADGSGFFDKFLCEMQE
jgi:hypothetical protein